MTMTNTDKSLLAVFYGYTTAPCSRGQAWVSPYNSASDDLWKLHGRLIRPHHAELEHLDFENSFDLPMKVVSTIEALGFQTRIGCEYVHDSIDDKVSKVVFFSVKNNKNVTHAGASLWNSSNLVVHEIDALKVRAINKGIIAFVKQYTNSDKFQPA